MIFPVALISVIFLITASWGSEESCYLSEEQEDHCASVCYPIVKPLLRYFEKTNQKDVELLNCKTDLQNEGTKRYAQLLKCQQDYSELVRRYFEMQDEGQEKHSEISKCKMDYSDLERRYSEVLNKLKDSELKYEQMINKKNGEIDLLENQIRELKKTNELATLTNQFREDIDKLEKILQNGETNKNNPTNSNNKTKKVEVSTRGVQTPSLPSISNPTTPKTETIAFPDPCPRNQKYGKVVRETQIPGSDPFKVVCFLNSGIGFAWLLVYSKYEYSKEFNRTYEEYERGFGNVGTHRTDEFFIGLKRLHFLLNKNPHEVNFNAYYASTTCDNFEMGDRSQGYNVKNIDNCTGADLWMMLRQGSKFSTFDRDEDGVPDRNLAKEGGYGWWFDPDMHSKKFRHYILEIRIRRRG